MFLLFSVDLFSHMTFIAPCEKTNKNRDISWNHLAKKKWRNLWATRNTLVVWFLSEILLSDPHIELLPYLYTCTIDSNLKLLLYHCIYIYILFLMRKRMGLEQGTESDRFLKLIWVTHSYWTKLIATRLIGPRSLKQLYLGVLFRQGVLHGFKQALTIWLM